MQCPNCRTPLAEEVYESVKIDRCPKCAGTWLDKGELVQILEIREMEFTAAFIDETKKSEKSGIPAEEVASIEPCPKCATPLVAVNYSYSSGVILDKCSSNDGIWLNAKELEKIQTHFERWEKQAESEGKTWGSNAVAEDSHAQNLHQKNLDQTIGKLGHVLFPLLYRLGKSIKSR